MAKQTIKIRRKKTKSSNFVPTVTSGVKTIRVKKK